MSSLAFDTHKFVRELTKANMPEAQAEVLAQHYANLLSDRLATKDDLKIQDKTIDAGYKDLKTDIKALRQDMVHLEDRMDDRFNNFEERMDDRFNNFEERMDDRFKNFEERINERFINLEERINERFINFEERINERFINFEERIDKRFINFEERINARIINVALKTQIAGVIITCGIIGLMLQYS